MLQMQQTNKQQSLGKKICMPPLRFKNILQAENAHSKT